MLRKTVLTLAVAAVAWTSSSALGATTKELVRCEGWRGLLCCTAIPDCICRWCCPDYCKKPLPCPCGSLPPNLSCGCGPTATWSCHCSRACRPLGCNKRCGDGVQDHCGNDVDYGPTCSEDSAFDYDAAE